MHWLPDAKNCEFQFHLENVILLQISRSLGRDP